MQYELTSQEQFDLGSYVAHSIKNYMESLFKWAPRAHCDSMLAAIVFVDAIAKWSDLMDESLIKEAKLN